MYIESLITRSPDLIATKKTAKDWGYELEIHNSPNFCQKILCFFPGKNGSLHSHREKSEAWYVAEGSFILKTVNPDNNVEEITHLSRGDTVNLPAGVKHQLKCVADYGGQIFEASTQHFDDDTYREYREWK